MKGISLENALLIASVTVGNRHVRRQAARTVAVAPPTPAQLARRERDDWNKAVAAKKAAKRGGKGKS